MKNRRTFLKQAGTGLAMVGFLRKASAGSLSSPIPPTIGIAKPPPKPATPYAGNIASPPISPPSGAGAQTIDRFTVSPPALNAGASAIVSWQTSNASRVALNGAVVASVGSQSVAPTATQTFTLQVDGNAPQLSQSLTLTVNLSTSPPAGGSQIVLWDGESGVCRDYCNFGARLPWENQGGDWSDAAQVPQGTSPYATLNWLSSGWGTAPITALVQRWYGQGNTGLYLKPGQN